MREMKGYLHSWNRRSLQGEKAVLVTTPCLHFLSILGQIKKISKRGEYALRALIDLGIAKELGQELVQITELAAQERLPIKFLEQILTQLKEAGYVESKRGRYGGYFLKMNPERIRFGNVIRLIDGALGVLRLRTAPKPSTLNWPALENGVPVAVFVAEKVSFNAGHRQSIGETAWLANLDFEAGLYTKLIKSRRAGFSIGNQPAGPVAMSCASALSMNGEPTAGFEPATC